MTKLQKEIKELGNADLVGRFETLTVSEVHEENSVRGLTKKTHYEWQLVHDELVRRLDAKTRRKRRRMKSWTTCMTHYQPM